MMGPREVLFFSAPDDATAASAVVDADAVGEVIDGVVRGLGLPGELDDEADFERLLPAGGGSPAIVVQTESKSVRVVVKTLSTIAVTVTCVKVSSPALRRKWRRVFREAVKTYQGQLQ